MSPVESGFSLARTYCLPWYRNAQGRCIHRAAVLPPMELDFDLRSVHRENVAMFYDHVGRRWGLWRSPDQVQWFASEDVALVALQMGCVP